MAIYKCKMCGCDIEVPADDTMIACPQCGAVQSFPQAEEPETNAAAVDVSEENGLRPMDEDALTAAEAEPEEAVSVAEEVSEEAAAEEISEEAATEEISEEAATEEAPAEETAEIPEAAADAAALLEQAVNFLALNDWDNATACCDQALETDGENPWAYLCKLLAELNVSRPENLKYLVTPFDTNENYQKTIAFADEHLRAELTGYIEHIRARNENARGESIYAQAQAIMASAETADAFREAAELFARIPEYADASDLARECSEKAEGVGKSAIYAEAMTKMSGDHREGYAEALELFRQIPGWKDADEHAAFCKQKLDELTTEKKAEDRKKKLFSRKKAQLRKRATIIRFCITAVLVIALVAAVLFVLFTPKRKYDRAAELRDAGKYDEAITAFEALKGYKDSKDQITECKYLRAVAMKNTEQYEAAIAAFEALEDYKDSQEQIPLCRKGILERDYKQGIAYLKKGEIVKAYELLAPLGDYKDSAERAQSIFSQYKVELMNDPQVGGSLFLGKYHQDQDKDNGMEDIEWIVLEIKNGRALVVSKYALEVKPLHSEQTAVTWEECSLRTWLNADFFEMAFSESERSQIHTVTVPAHAVPDSKTVPGNATEDRLFLLSYEEVTTYFASDKERQCRETAYTTDNDEEENDTLENRWWWLRTPGFYQSSFMCVSSNGSINDFGIGVNRDKGTVRPAMWIELN